MIPVFLRSRKYYILLAIAFTITLMLGLSYAFFSRQSLLGESSNNIISIQTIDGTSQSFITTYENGNNEIVTGILNLNTTPYTKMSKFTVQNIYDYSLNVTINWTFVTSTLIQSDTSYDLYECSSANYNNATLSNVASLCTLISPSSGNVLPNTGETTKLQSENDITMDSNQIRYYVVGVSIGVSNDGKNFQGIIKVKDRFMHSLTIHYDNGSDSTSMYMANGDTITLPDPTKIGHTFYKWQMLENYNSSLSGSSFTMGSENTTIIAIYNPNTYTIVYNSSAATNGTTANSIHTYGNSKTLNINGYKKIITGSSGMVHYFRGWDTSSSATNPVYTDGQSVINLTTQNNATINLYAVWGNVFYYTSTYNVLNDSNGDWRIKFLASGNLTIYKNILIDIFAVGGGGGASTRNEYNLAAGAGGYTNTVKDVALNTTITYPIVIGAGGSSEGGTGGTSSFNVNVCTAAGGAGGYQGSNNSNGGSAGGGWDRYTSAIGGGSNGSTNTSGGGAGQGRTTREFGEASGDLYAGGGGGPTGAGGAGGGGDGTSKTGTKNNGNGVPNTGGGGANQGKIGGSGIVIIRNARSRYTLPSIINNFTYSGNYAVISDDGVNWRIKLLSSGNFRSTTTMYVDIFAVGGGGGGGNRGEYNLAAGAGGYTSTTMNSKIIATTIYPVVVGSGGAGAAYGGAGGQSSFNSTWCKANGGSGGAQGSNSSNGGSAGGGWNNVSSGIGGGSNGSTNTYGGGLGQNSTTREFGETYGDLYGGGGGGPTGAGGAGGGGDGTLRTGVNNGGNGFPNTGGGGGNQGKNGGSGIVIIRNHR